MPGKLDKWIWSNSRETGIREASRSAVKAGIADHSEAAVLNELFKKSSARSFSTTSWKKAHNHFRVQRDFGDNQQANSNRESH